MSDDVDEQKRVEFYSAGLTAWYTTRLEHDKSLLTLSAGGIGLLMTLMTTVGVSSAESLVLYVCALVAFLICLGAVLVIFRKNATHLEEVIAGTASQNDSALTRLDIVGTWSFAFGVVFSVVIGISAAINSYGNVEKKMSRSDQKQSNPGIVQESFNGAARLQPQADLTKSFNGIAKLQPPSPQSSSSTESSPPPSAPPQSTQK